MLLSNNPKIIASLKAQGNKVSAYDDFMTIFEQLNFKHPDMIIFDLKLIKYDQQYMLESLPKKTEKNYIELVAIGNCRVKEKMADFSKITNEQEFIIS